MPYKIETADIYEDLRTKLITAHFDPGSRLKPADLMGDYGCSANTLRETLFRLSTCGLVAFEEQRGFRVRPVSRQRQHDQQGPLDASRQGDTLVTGRHLHRPKDADPHADPPPVTELRFSPPPQRSRPGPGVVDPSDIAPATVRQPDHYTIVVECRCAGLAHRRRGKEQ